MTLPDGHADKVVTQQIVDVLVNASGSEDKLRAIVGQILRECIDRVIQTPKTGRLFYEDLQNTEKTYIGTCVEIDLRSRLGLKRGKVQDLLIAGRDVDVKFTGRGKSWMIPPEAYGHPCLLISANEEKSEFTMGVIIAKEEYLNPGRNRDVKTGISAASRANVHWVFESTPYPRNFWLTVPKDSIDRISEGRSGNERMMTLFREVQDRPISRKVVADVAGQLDFTRRVRADGRRGTRNRLASDRILILSGTKSRDVLFAKKLGLPSFTKTEYLAHQLSNDEVEQARQLGFSI